jgi:hypothetical protein
VQGINVDIKVVDGMPTKYEGCHTIMLNDYAIEGHVSAKIIEKLMQEHPANVVGICLPEMLGVPGRRREGRTVSGLCHPQEWQRDGLRDTMNSLMAYSDCGCSPTEMTNVTQPTSLAMRELLYLAALADGDGIMISVSKLPCSSATSTDAP